MVLHKKCCVLKKLLSFPFECKIFVHINTTLITNPPILPEPRRFCPRTLRERCHQLFQFNLLFMNFHFSRDHKNIKFSIPVLYISSHITHVTQLDTCVYFCLFQVDIHTDTFCLLRLIHQGKRTRQTAIFHVIICHFPNNYLFFPCLEIIVMWVFSCVSNLDVLPETIHFWPCA